MGHEKETSSKRRGRPVGSKGKLKLESQRDEIQHYLNIGLSKRKTAKRLGVGYNTLDRFLKRQDDTLSEDNAPVDTDGRDKNNA